MWFVIRALAAQLLIAPLIIHYFWQFRIFIVKRTAVPLSGC